MTTLLPRNAKIISACFGEPPAFARIDPKFTGARKQGILYERRVHANFMERFGDFYIPSPWIYYVWEYKGKRELSYCQPDAILLDFHAGTVHIIEVKLRHTHKAGEQLNFLYRPLLRHIFPPDLWKVRGTEVTKWYDCATYFPFPFKLREEPNGTDGDYIGIHILDI